MGSFGIAGGLVLLGYALNVTVCPLRRWTGIPCPLCGGTRAVVALLTGRFADAFHIHPLVTVAAMLGVALFGVLSLCALFGRRVPRLALSHVERIIATLLLALLFLAQWLFELAIWHDLC